ncbi:hypothetical protein NFI96_006560 [Prochilodus magdalenae]|nr:hypothetical protein NFI96_006560 [Prochilodus magdalenae]
MAEERVGREGVEYREKSVKKEWADGREAEEESEGETREIKGMRRREWHGGPGRASTSTQEEEDVSIHSGTSDQRTAPHSALDGLLTVTSAAHGSVEDLVRGREFQHVTQQDVKSSRLHFLSERQKDLKALKM